MSPERFVKGESERTLISLPLNLWCLHPLFLPGLRTADCTYKCIDKHARGPYPLPVVASHAIRMGRAEEPTKPSQARCSLRNGRSRFRRSLRDYAA